MVNKNIDHQKLLYSCRFRFYKNINWHFLMSISIEFFQRIIRMRNLRRTNCTTITFPWSVLPLIIALIQSNCEKLLSYCKKLMVSPPQNPYPLDSDYPIDIAKMLTF